MIAPVIGVGPVPPREPLQQRVADARQYIDFQYQYLHLFFTQYHRIKRSVERVQTLDLGRL